MITISCSRIQQQEHPTCCQSQLRRLIRILKRELKISMRQIALLLDQVCLVQSVLQVWEALVPKLLYALMAPPIWVSDPAEVSLKYTAKLVNSPKIRE